MPNAERGEAPDGKAADAVGGAEDDGRTCTDAVLMEDEA